MRKIIIATIILVSAAVLFTALLTHAQHPDEPEEDRNERERVYATAEIQRIIEQRQKEHQNEQAATGECHSPFGSLLGVANGVPAFSNCNDDTISMEDDTVLWDPVDQKVYYKGELDAAKRPATSEIENRLVAHVVGMAHQCVDFARRYLLEKIGLVFQDCAAAVEIWRFTFLFGPLDRGWHTRYELERFPNFATGKVVNEKEQQFSNLNKQRPPTPAEKVPRPNDIVIWPIQKDMPFGHVAIVTEVLPQNHPRCKELGCGKLLSDSEAGEATKEKGGEGKDTLIAVVRIGEQNYHNKPWPGSKTYARELHLYRQADTNLIGIKDPDGYRTLGWMRPRQDLGEFKGAYSHADDGEGVSTEGMIPRAEPEKAKLEYMNPEQETASPSDF